MAPKPAAVVGIVIGVLVLVAIIVVVVISVKKKQQQPSQPSTPTDTTSDTDADTDETTTTDPQPMDPYSVFHLKPKDGHYTLDRVGAEAACQAVGARLASREELDAAQSAGAQWCSCAWTSGTGEGAYPMQVAASGCGDRAGVIDCAPGDWNNQGKYNATCYGKQPTSGLDSYTIAPFKPGCVGPCQTPDGSGNCPRGENAECCPGWIGGTVQSSGYKYCYPDPTR